MTETVAEKPEDTKKLLALEKQLADDAYLHRDGGGFQVSLFLLPSIDNPKTAKLEVKTGDGAKIDTIKVELDKAWDAFHHTTQYSEKLLEFLGGKKKEK